MISLLIETHSDAMGQIFTLGNACLSAAKDEIQCGPNTAKPTNKELQGIDFFFLLQEDSVSYRFEVWILEDW